MMDFLADHIQLENERVLLKPITAAGDIQLLKHIIFDDSIWEYMGLYIRNEEDLANYINDAVTGHGKNFYVFLIIDKRTHEIAGSTRYGNINFASKKLEIGWTWIGKKFQATGLNKACKYELLKFGFEVLKLRRIQFSADLENLRSQRAIEKLGASREGIFRNNYVDSTGKSKDDVYFSIINEDWEKLKKNNFREFELTGSTGS